MSFKQDIPYIYLSRGYLNFSSYSVNSVYMVQESSLFPDYGYRFKLHRYALGDPTFFLARCGEKDLVDVILEIDSHPCILLRAHYSDPNKCGSDDTFVYLDYLEGCKELVSP